MQIPKSDDRPTIKKSDYDPNGLEFEIALMKGRNMIISPIPIRF